MLKGLAAWVLNTYLGKYLENLNTDQLSIALLQGEVELENIPLKKDALNSFELPLEIRAGFVQKIKVTIPLTRLRSEPWVVSIEGLYIVAGPVQLNAEFNEEAEEQNKQFRKLSQLDAIEARWRAAHDAQQESSYYAASYSSWFSYGASLVSNIVENVQLNIYDVHIRYEDAQTNPAAPFAWGITISSLTAQSAAKDWASHFVDRSDMDATRKLMELQNLAVYWDTNATLFGQLPFQQLRDAFKQFQANLSDNVNKCGKKLKFIIEPVSSRARLLRNRNPNPLRSRSSPRFICDVTVDNFLVTLNDDQYQSMTFWMREFDKLEKYRGLVKGRPVVGVKEDIKAWWRYAIGCQVDDVRKRWRGRNWESAHRRSKDNVIYVKAYTEHLKNPVTCPVAFREHKDRIELELTFEELMILREVAMDRMKTFKSAVNDEGKKKVQGILRSWFPLYRGWYSSAAAAPLVPEDATAKSDPVENSSESRQGLEEEILDVLNDTVENDTMLRRDTVFAQVNFTLKKGTFSLCSARAHSDKDGNMATSSSQILFELGFVEMAICFELRPRTGSIMFKVSLGDMHLCDKVTAGSVFPQLIASHGAGAVFAVQKPLIDAAHYQPKHQRLSSPRHSYDSPLFEFTYESKPFDSTAAFRVHMKSRSLDIVYNPLVLAKFREFLASPYRTSAGGFRITDAARSRYEELKRQTQDQLKKNLEKILEGEQPSVQQWDIHLQISAPQIIIPENLFDSNTTVIVCDFGHLQFSTASSRVQTKICDDIEGSDSEEDFKTPCSSPPDDDVTDHKWSFMKSSHFQPSLSSVQEISSPSNITEFALHKRMYDSYMLDFSDLQIMVCKATDNWRHAYLRGTSSLHVLDKFTISLQLNRRIVYTNDPLWPNATLLGNLPKLVVHVNEQKIQAVKTCLAILGTSAAKPHWTASDQRQDDFVVPQDKDMGLAEPLESNCKELQDDSHLLVMQFNVEQMSLEIQSRGRSVAELQVKGIRVKFRKQPHNVSMTLTVHSLLLVDALQTFGPDFELLFASHKNVCIDTMSGSLRDSDPTSPASPTSSYVSVTSPFALNSALSNLQLQQLSSSAMLELQSPLFLLDAHDSEALIVIEITIVDCGHEDYKKPSICCASVRFNNLDIIANQETIVELLGFLNRTELTNFRRPSNATPLYQEVTKNVINEDLISELATQSLVVTFEFHTLSILLMKSVKKDCDLVAHKIATATMTGAKIQANFGSEVEISGSLGGLQVLDLSDLATKYKKILCVGRDPLEERPLSLTERLHAEVYGEWTASPEWTAESSWEENKAFSFEVTCPASSFTGEDSHKDGDCLSVKLRVASVCYTYTQHFLSELASCASEFRQYAIKLANSIRSAAAEMAYEIVARKTHFLGDAATHPSETVVKSKSQSRSWFANFQLRLDVVLESPVVLVPESAISGNVLESRLGRITIRNCKLDHTCEEFAETLNLENGTTVKVDGNKSERVQLEIRNINVHSLHWDATSKSTFSYRPQELRAQSDKRFPILHDTAVNVSVDWLVGEGVSQDIDEETYQVSDCHNVWNVAMIEGQVINSLKVSLVKHQYRQILRTLNYLMASSKPSETPENWQTSSDDRTDIIFSTDSQQFDTMYIDSTLPLVTEMRQSFAIKAALSLPEFRVELHPGINEMQNDIVALVFQDFLFNLERVDSHRTMVEVTLKGVVMEDLHQEPSSKNRYLMKSSHRTTKEIFAQRAKFLSTSCPDILHHHPILLSQQSLPDKLNTENVFRNFQKREQRMLYGSNYRGRSLEPGTGQYECPYTPPPSPMCNSPEGEKSMADALVNVKVILVDKECPQFSSKYNSINRSVDVNFNALDMIINLQSWVMVLDFFDISNVDTSLPTSKEIRFDIPNDLIHEEPINTETYVKVRSLTLVFNKDCQEMAKANVSNFYARLTSRDGHFMLVGKLGSMSLKDLTGFGQLYPERFLTVGKEALDFTYSKHNQVDNEAECDHDACLKLTMSSVVYVHTNRFYTEMMAFFQHFNQLQTALAMGREPSTDVGRVTRVLLDIQAGSPVILVPRSAFSNQMIVANLGNLTVKNRFLFSGCEGTLGARKGVTNEKVFATGGSCLLDVLSVELQEMDLYSAERLELDKKPGNVQALDINFSGFVVMKRGEPLLKQKCELQLQIERNLHVDFNHAVPDIAVNGEISTVHCSVDVEQYKLINGILKHNLGEEVEVEIPTMHFASFPTHPKDQMEIWTCMSFHVDLVNVTLELFVSHRPSSNSRDQSLAQIDLFQSRLTFKRFSDQSREVDLVSQEILMSDTRFKDAPANQRPNVFFHILQPMSNSKQGLLQAEINYRSTPVFSRLTVVLNNMRVMAVFDWWSAFLSFISVKDDDAAQGITSSYEEIEKLSRNMEVSAHGASKPFSSKYAVSISSGVVTKRAPLLEEDKLSYEFKINVTETEVVVVEDTASWDSNAVILKSTTVLAYRPMFIAKPLSCSLQSLEVFSCILGLEDDTALSIIDPLTINIDINGRPKPGHSGGLLDATSIGEITHVLEVSLHDLSIHVSYHDMVMFASILESVPRQANLVKHYNGADNVKVKKLQGMGFDAEDCNNALIACQGNLDDAAIWLTQNAATTMVSQTTESHQLKSIDVKVLDVRVACICICLIDDCKDADVPLAELTLSGLHLHQSMGYRVKGTASYVLGGDFYNRALSGWEPFLEPWRCRVTWDKAPLSSRQGDRLSITFKGEDVLNFNLSSTLLQLYRNVKANWTDDYYGLSSKQQSDPNEIKTKFGPTSNIGLRKRTPFVPFALKNSTGSKLHFVTATSSPDKLLPVDSSGGHMAYYGQGNRNWISVPPGSTVPFTFEGRGKHRHRGTHDVKVHQLIVVVEGWQEMAPVSVDKVGVFFRQARPQINRAASVYTEIPPARVVFAVTLEGQAQKLVTVRSALQIRNRLGEAVTLRMENSVFQLGVSTVTQVKPDSTIAVPLLFTCALLSVCPSSREHELLFCSSAIGWQHVTKQNETRESVFTCLPRSISGRFMGLESYKFCVRVTREKFPLDSVNTGSATSQQRSRGYPASYGLGVQPGHLITLLPPVTIINLLPYELSLSISGINMIGTLVKPGNETAIFSVDVTSSVTSPLEISFAIEGFKLCNDLVILPDCGNFTSVLRLVDSRDRLLFINARISTRFGCSYQVSLLAHYWLVNRSGLPLVFRQEGSGQEAAGQFVEHETARSINPLMFSFAGGDFPELCSMRVGQSVHADGEPQWCSHFNLEKGIRFRRLKVLAPNFRPEWVYSIGIDVRVGRGQYRDTHIVTLSPRFYIENNSKYQIELTQKFLIEKGNMARNRLTAMSKSSLPFHWTRVDLEQLLCVRIVSVPDCHWSGGFFIEKIDSFHINMRDGQGKSCFLRVEVVLQGATYRVIFVDADQMPPPYRIDNLSEVPITFQQTDVSIERLRTVVRPGSKVSYAWDEPTLRPLIDCCAHGGISATYNMNQFGEGKKLSYENFIYVAFDITFHRHPSSFSCKQGDYRCQELVLDVPTGTRVVLSKKEPSKRTQLWRMTTTGLLQHEGSSPPRDPKRSSSAESDRVLVLDIADIGSSPNTYVGLILRKPDQRRSSTQTWKFTEDGRLCCQHRNLYVQPKDGLHGLRPGNDVVLGQTQMICLVMTDSGIPVEQAICRQRLRPGSGILDVKVVPDGPTRVLQVSDIRGKTSGANIPSQSSDWVIVEDTPAANSDAKRETSTGHVTDIQLVIHLPEGMGLSLVNHIPEELVYIFFKNITLDLVKTSTEETANGTVENFTVNNQLFNAELPVLIFVTPSLKTDSRHHLPAITFTAHRVPSTHQNVDIFKLVMVDVKNVTVQIEERLLWKLVQFFRGGECETEFQERDHEFHMRNMHSVTSVQAKRYYFNNLKLILNQMRLSVITSSRLPADLKDIKHKMGLTLVRFADAQVELDPFVRVHPFETAQFILDAMLEHYKEELKSQAAKILGAVDFLGNPLGLMNDVTEGLSGLVNEGNFGGLVKNVTHGLSNSAAKVMGTLSEGLSVVTMDDKHQEKRKKITSEQKAGSSDHIMAGLKGLGVGLLGGVTSIFTQTYEGASNEGLPGFISGFGKGLVGTVTKPAAGVLDFATGAASAVRDTSRSSIHEVPERPRPTRLCVGPDGLLPKYSAQQARGQARLYALNRRDYTERFFGYEQLSSGSEGLFTLISDRRVYILGHDTPSADSIISPVELGELLYCRTDQESSTYDTKHYIELVKQVSTNEISPISGSIKRPKFVCDTESIAVKVAQQINYAKSFYDDRVHTLVVSNDIDD